jgi:DNA polymerase III alpha subunit
LGLIQTSARGDNNYRYYDRALLDEVQKIRDLQGLGFSLNEIKEVLMLGKVDVSASLLQKLADVESELGLLSERRDRLRNLLSISQRVEGLQAVRLHERRMYMDVVKEMVLGGLRARKVAIKETHLNYLQREEFLYDQPEKRQFINAVKQCVEFAREQKLQLGPGRGAGPASLVMYGLGLSEIDPTDYDLIPERWSTRAPEILIDVEYDRGQMFVDYCRRVSEGLSWGKINAFKMPLIDIISNVHTRIGKVIDYRSIDNDDDVVLGNIRAGDIDKIFQLDYSPDALLLRGHKTKFPEYEGTAKLKEYLRSQKIHSFRDVINLIAVWRPFREDLIERIERYRQAKLKPVRYAFLTPELQASLEPNFGVVIYIEDLIRIVSTYSGWGLDKCGDLVRHICFNRGLTEEFKDLVTPEIFEFVKAESPCTFLKAHSMSFTRFTKQTAVLQNLHRDVYFDEIKRWEDQHGFVWDDVGIKVKGISYLQN